MSERRGTTASALMILFILAFVSLGESYQEKPWNKASISTSSKLRRKNLLVVGGDDKENESTGLKCNISDISITQNQLPSAPGATAKTFLVIITAKCPDGCSISGIHLGINNFISNIPFDPHVLKSLGNNDWLVNDGKPVDRVSFEYAFDSSYRFHISAFRSSSRWALNI
ncbi:OLC1v1006794C1 [Oldenlandia corymbosa var. corymbosa]|uniref:OLC1v1006794C1 n=1 Tax=Oldenlandia corymbosa var. corymbosa TaxID=529605 RepID=A0AAV1DKK2_OLDCO|nr:OLC1v1006794C1 [Oldenlandia corymbosa var. corymbosa]